MTTSELDAQEVSEQVTDWVHDAWSPDLPLGEWWQLLADAGYAAPHWPTEWFGRGWPRGHAVLVQRVLRSLNVPGPPAGLGLMLAGPTILAHGTDDQKRRFLPGIVSGSTNWCQLFSEPAAGSDLASLTTRATHDGTQWIITGQKVWTSNGQLADYGMLLARTDPESHSHHGITWFALDMNQPEIDVRPLREMTGRSLFTEVFIDGAVTSDDNVIGELHAGWPVARTTLMNERMGLGGAGGAVGAMPGARGGMLVRRAGDAVHRTSGPSSGTALAMRGRAFEEWRALAATRPLSASLRDELIQLYVHERIAQLTQQRAQDEGAAGLLAKAGGSVGKLLVTQSTQRAREVGMSILGAEGMLWRGDRSPAGVVQEQCLFSPAVSIYGGADQIQRNILAERTLGLPR
ncbi:MAG TPA: acyl-CoA dehydrogenase family protein [Acidimicrobiales bacterium]|nr:acyl-CoA dehydrogenase family protein [Acidimicrobiales bacterium]